MTEYVEHIIVKTDRALRRFSTQDIGKRAMFMSKSVLLEGLNNNVDLMKYFKLVADRKNEDKEWVDMNNDDSFLQAVN